MKTASTLFFIYQNLEKKAIAPLNSDFLTLFEALKKICQSGEMKYNAYHEDDLFKVEVYIEDSPIHHIDCILASFRIFSEYHSLRLEQKPIFYPNI